MEVAAALRSGLYNRAQVLQLLRAPLSCEPLDLSLLNQPTETQAPTQASAADTGTYRSRTHKTSCCKTNLVRCCTTLYACHKYMEGVARMQGTDNRCIIALSVWFQ